MNAFLAHWRGLPYLHLADMNLRRLVTLESQQALAMMAAAGLSR